MKQYLNLLQEIKDKGTINPAARAGMPSTLSLFGAQYRCSLSEGFPLLTTKEIKFKHIVTELLWFLRGDTNIKYLVDNGCNIWNEDAYSYYQKLCKPIDLNYLPFEQFISEIKSPSNGFNHLRPYNYEFGDCGWQYGKLWRNWDYIGEPENMESDELYPKKSIDQIQELINGLKNNPESRRHILTALNPAHYNDLALFPCHVVAQFNCRPLTIKERSYLAADAVGGEKFANYSLDFMDGLAIPKYYLECQLYQRSCDVFLGVPYNTASYALLIHILSEICGFVPGDFIHTFGDVHIYENHMKQVDEQLSRTPIKLPTLKCFTGHKSESLPDHFEKYLTNRYSFDDFISKCTIHDFVLENYNPQPAIKAKLSTGLK